MPYGTVNADVIQTSTSGGILGAGNASIMKNRIINGAMVIDQRNGGASFTPTNGGFGTDRWKYTLSQTSKITGQQSSTAPVGFSNSLLTTSSSAYSIGTGDYFAIYQSIEGFNFADCAWGTANAKTVTLSFQVYSSLTGTFGGSITNSGQSRCYPFSYTVSSANTWTTVSVTIAGDTTGTWIGATNGIGAQVWFGLGVGSTYSGTAGAWNSTSFCISATGATSVVGTSGATFYITGVQLEVGSSATGFEYVNYQTSLANCQRYYEKSYDASVVANTNTNNGNLLIIGSSNGSSLFGYVGMKIVKRTAPTVTIYPPSSGTVNTFENGGTIGGSYIGDSGFGMYTLTLTNSRTTAQWLASAEL